MNRFYFISFLLVTAFLLMLIHIALLGATTSVSLFFMNEEYGSKNFLIIRAVAIITSMTTGILAAPLGYLARDRSALYGLALPILGFILFFGASRDQVDLAMFQSFAPEYMAYILSCWGFWIIGRTLYLRPTKAQRDAVGNEGHHGAN